jgi:hypothetical protein
VAAVLIAFGAWYWHWTGRPKDLETEAGAHVLVSQRSDAGMDARAVGELALAGDCLGIKRGATVDVVVWPHGTEATRDGVLLPDGTVAAVGDLVEGDGGFVEDDPDNPRVPDDCPQGAYFLAASMTAPD